ncbi:MAG: hypothetical protein CSB46_08995 [Micrococcales bacterium]|nr:MAG: hypothetical protein CSB46_08995 [Micrococcales bacterium]
MTRAQSALAWRTSCRHPPTRGPFDYPGKDGSTFGNYEGHLPPQQRGFYREYTVRTPGVDHRGARRIVTGGFDQDDPEHWYYTGDHYESFCEFSP